MSEVTSRKFRANFKYYMERIRDGAIICYDGMDIGRVDGGRAAKKTEDRGAEKVQPEPVAKPSATLPATADDALAMFDDPAPVARPEFTRVKESPCTPSPIAVYTEPEEEQTALELPRCKKCGKNKLDVYKGWEDGEEHQICKECLVATYGIKMALATIKKLQKMEVGGLDKAKDLKTRIYKKPEPVVDPKTRVYTKPNAEDICGVCGVKAKLSATYIDGKRVNACDDCK